MHPRKTLTLATAVLTSGLVGLLGLLGPTPTANADIAVGGSTAAGSLAIDGVFAGGTLTFGGNTYGCSSGTVAGAIARGVPTSADISLSTVQLSCSHPWGTMTISLSSDCTIRLNYPGTATRRRRLPATDPQRPGLSVVNQAGCLGLLTDAASLNNVTFNTKLTAGATTGIDSRQTPPRWPGDGNSVAGHRRPTVAQQTDEAE